MKILFITNMYPITSPFYGIFVKEQIDEITKTIACEHDLYYINAREKGSMEYLFSMFNIPLKIIKHKYDIIHIHYGLSALFLSIYKPMAKVYLTLHGSDILEKQGKNLQVYVTKFLLKRVDKVFIQSKEMEPIIRPFNKNYEILPCGVNTDFFKPDRKIKNDERTKTVIFPGNRSAHVKNYSVFEKVIGYLKEQSSFLIKQEFIDNLSREEVRDILNTGDCLLMTSISEGSPQVVKEALSCGLPVVSVPVGDVPFMIESVPHCYISKTYSAEELGTLVLKSFLGNGNDIRDAFIRKNIYDHRSVARRLIKNYGIELQVE